MVKSASRGQASAPTSTPTLEYASSHVDDALCGRLPNRSSPRSALLSLQKRLSDFCLTLTIFWLRRCSDGRRDGSASGLASDSHDGLRSHTPDGWCHRVRPEANRDVRVLCTFTHLNLLPAAGSGLSHSSLSGD